MYLESTVQHKMYTGMVHVAQALLESANFLTFACTSTASNDIFQGVAALRLAVVCRPGVLAASTGMAK